MKQDTEGIEETELSESELTNEAFRISEHTNSDGTVTVDIIDVQKQGSDDVAVKFKTPLGDVKEEVMPWPDSEDSSYKIVRICENTVGSLTGIEQIKQFSIPASPDNWELLPEAGEKTGARERIINFLSVHLSFDTVITFLLGSLATVFVTILLMGVGNRYVNLFFSLIYLLFAIVILMKTSINILFPK